MIETAAIEINAKSAERRAPSRDDAAPGFSFSAAVSALETRAAQSLEAHGAAPANADLSGRDTSKSSQERTASAPRETASPSKAAADTASTTGLSTVKRGAPEQARSHQPQPVAALQQAPALQAAIANAASAPALTVTTTAMAAKGDAAALRAVDLTRPEAPKAPRAAVPTHKPDVPAQDFAKLLARRLDTGATQFELRLDPPDLGKVEASLRIADDSDNVLALKFENQSALDLFARDEANLRAALSSSGFEFNGERIVFELAPDNTSEAMADSAHGAIAYEPVSFAPFSNGAVDIRI